MIPYPERLAVCKAADLARGIKRQHILPINKQMSTGRARALQRDRYMVIRAVLYIGTGSYEISTIAGKRGRKPKMYAPRVESKLVTQALAQGRKPFVDDG